MATKYSENGVTELVANATASSSSAASATASAATATSNNKLIVTSLAAATTQLNSKYGNRTRVQSKRYTSFEHQDDYLSQKIKKCFSEEAAHNSNTDESAEVRYLLY